MQKKNCFRPNPDSILYSFTYLYPYAYPPTNCEFISHNSEKKRIASLYQAILRKKVIIARCKLAIARKKTKTNLR